jgi:hypothetical protein
MSRSLYGTYTKRITEMNKIICNIHKEIIGYD